MIKQFYSTIFDCALSSRCVQKLLCDFDFRKSEDYNDYTNFRNMLNEDLQKEFDSLIFVMESYYEDCVLDNYMVMLNVGIKMDMELSKFFFMFED